MKSSKAVIAAFFVFANHCGCVEGSMVESPIEDGNESEGHIQSNEGTAVRAAGNRSPQMRKAIAQRNGSEGEVNGGGSLGNVEPKLPAFMFPEENQQGQSPYIQDQDIIDGTWLLYSLQLEETIHTVGGSDYQGQIQGLFCEIDLSAQKEDPSKAPFFTNFVRGAKCGQAGNHVSLDLHDIVQKTRAFDLDHAEDHSNPIKSIEPTAFLYHEGRCGSTLVSNSVTALAPERTRTYSEPMPALQALLDCDKTRVNCNVEKAANVFRDVVYMMGRTSNPVEDRMFFKLLPASILGVSVVKKAFPDVPWAFIYRDPVHVMVSNLRQKGSDKAPGPYCTGLQKHKYQSEYIQDLALTSSGKVVEELSREEYCAAYLATLTGAAAEELAFTEGGMGVNYEDMPGVLLDTLFPQHFGLPVGEKETEHVLAQFGVYSKRMKRINPKEAKDDSAEKEEEASAEVRDAVNLFLSKSYGILQFLKEGQDVPSLQRKLTGWNESQTAEKSSAITVYDPSLASKQQRQLNTSPTACNIAFFGEKICCPQGSVKTVTSAFDYNSLYCSIFYPPFAYTATYDCPFRTNTADTACGGATYLYTSEITDFQLEANCPAPTSSPTSLPTSAPTSPPTSLPTSAPTSPPTSLPTSAPTSPPTSLPTSSPTSPPTSLPTSQPTSQPTSTPTATPTSTPSSTPSLSAQPSDTPSSTPSLSAQPSDMPSDMPSDAPSDMPSDVPWSRPSFCLKSKTKSPGMGKGKGTKAPGKGKGEGTKAPMQTCFTTAFPARKGKGKRD